MQSRGTVSVCMATYNGAQFVEEQLESILAEMGPDDEIVVVDDASGDDTRERVAAIEDARIRLLPLVQNVGHVKAFEHAIGAARGEVIFLADQDDLWVPGRLLVMLDALDGHAVVATNVIEFDPAGRERLVRLVTPGFAARLASYLLLLLGRQPYFGCAMGFRSDLRSTLLPFPAFVEAHDHWLAVAGLVSGGVSHVDQPSLRRRIHGGNVSSPSRRSLAKISSTRLRMIGYLLLAAARRLRRSGRP